MFALSGLARAAFIILCFGLVAGCSQTTTGSSSFSGTLDANQRQAKILAARKKAKADRADRKAKFLEKRKLKRKARKTKKTTGTKTAKRSNNKKRVKNVKVKIRSIKGTTYAYVGGRSRGITKKAPWGCVPKRLKVVLSQISRKFGRVIINSTHRSHKHNRRVGGKRRSYHLKCQAVDFRVKGRTRGLTRWLANHPFVGGYNRYPSGYYHIDTGPKRTW